MNENQQPSSRTCPQCAAPLPADAPQGHCPQCLLALALQAAPGDATGNPTIKARTVSSSEPPSTRPLSPICPRPASRRSFWVIFSMSLALLIAIAVPNFVTQRTTRCYDSCTTNLKRIDGAVQQWALETKKAATDTYSLSDPKLLAYMKDSMLPVCPAGGRYSPGTKVSGRPACSFAAQGHTL